MPECEKCGRKFRSAQALGGHKSNAHPETRGNAQAPPGSQAEAAGQQDVGARVQGPLQPKADEATAEARQANVEAGCKAEPGAPVDPSAQAPAAMDGASQQPPPEATPVPQPRQPSAEGGTPPAPSASAQAPATIAGDASQPQQPEKPAQAQPQKGQEKADSSNAPPSNKAQPQLPPPAGSPVQAGKPEVEEMSQAERIRHYLGVGYTLEQLQKPPFNFKESTVRQEVDKVIAPLGEKQGGPTRMPMVLKAGAGQELISPEAIIQNYLVPEGEAGVWMLRGFMLYRAAQLAVMTDVEIMKGQSDAQAKALRPIMDIMEQARTDMDAAAQRAKDSNNEIAMVAAAEVAARAAAHIDARFEEMKAQKPDIASTPDPIKGMMARTMEMLTTLMMGALMPGSQTGATPGFVDKRTQGGK